MPVKRFTLPLLLALTGIVSAQTKVQPAQGGTGVDSSHSTGCASVTGGVWSFSPSNCGGGGGSGNVTTPGMTLSFLPKATGSQQLGDSLLSDDGTQLLYPGTGGIAWNDGSNLGGGFSLNENTSPPGVAGRDMLFAYISNHRLMMNPNNAGALIIVGMATAGTGGHCPQFAANGIDLIDSGGVCGGGGSGLNQLTGDVTAGPGTGSQAATIAANAVTTTKIANSNVTLAKIANASASSKLIGSGASGSGVPYVEITLGTNLSMSGTTLNATGGGGGGSPGGSSGQIQYNNAGSFGGAVGSAVDGSGNTTVTSLVATNGISSGTAPVGCPTTGCIALTEASSAGTPTAGTDYFRADSTTHRIVQSLNGGSELAMAYVVASGTAALVTTAISSGACVAITPVTATGALTTDVLTWWVASDPTAITGYAPVTTGGVQIVPWITSGLVNVKVCNPTTSSITPGALTINWRIMR